jgi:hypothetical protein
MVTLVIFSGNFLFFAQSQAKMIAAFGNWPSPITEQAVAAEN